MEAWAHQSGRESGLPCPICQPRLVHFPQMIQKVSAFSISQKVIEKKSYSGGCGISGLVLVVKNLPASAGRCKTLGFDPCVGKILWHGNPLQYCCLENPMDRGVWQAAVHEVAKSWTPLKWLNTHAGGISKQWFI